MSETLKKSQITGQVFIYIMVILVIGLLFFLGYKYVGELLGQKCKTDKATFIQNIQDAITSYDGYNVLQNKNFPAACDYKEVCFVDTEGIKAGTTTNITDAIIKASVQQNIENNIFLVGKTTEPIGYSEKIVVDGNSICISRQNNVFKIQFKGLAGKTSIDTFE
jgi:hypothetical protein